MKIFCKLCGLRWSLPFLFFILIGCESDSTGKADSPHTSPAPVLKPVLIRSGIEAGHPVGIRLAIQKRRDTDTTTVFELLSSYESKPIGLTLVIPREGITKSARAACLKSLGPPSDLFLQVLADQYKQRLNSTAKFADSVSCTCMNLTAYFKQTDSASEKNWLAAGYKLFFDSESIDGDAELFMNINIDQQWIEFPEKDEEYRAHLISLFTQPSPSHSDNKKGK